MFCRFIYVVKYFIDNGFYVIIENHLSEKKKNDSDSTVVLNGAPINQMIHVQHKIRCDACDRA